MYEPDDDGERAVHDQLVALVDGTARPAADDAPKEERARDWLDDIIDSDATAPAEEPEAEAAPEPRAWWSHKRSGANTSAPQQPEETEARSDSEDAEEPEEPRDTPRAFEPQPGYWPRPHIPAAVTRTWDRSETAISPKTRSFLYNASAAGAGWALGLYHQFAWALNDCGTSTGISGALVLGIGGSLLIAHVWDRRTRHWWPGIAWAARIPLATAMLALALYAPASV